MKAFLKTTIVALLILFFSTIPAFSGSIPGFALWGVYDGNSLLSFDYPYDPPNIMANITGINDSGQIVGYYTDTGTASFAFQSDLDGSPYTTFEYPGAFITDFYGINDAGQILGWAWGPGPSGDLGFVKDGDSLTSFAYNDYRFQVSDINDSGQIVGTSYAGDTQYGFIKDGDVFTTFQYPGYKITIFIGINDSGQIIGETWGGTNPSLDFLLDGDFYTIIEYPGASATQVTGINDAGQIVGWYYGDSGFRGFLLDGDTYTTLDLNVLEGGIYTVFPYDINDSGQILVGIDLIIPELATMLLLGTGLIGLTWLRRKQFFKSNCT